MPLRPTGIQVHIRLARLVCKLRLALRLGRLVLLRHRNTTTTVLILMFRCVDWRAQVVKMLAVVVAMFATLWLPYRSYVVYNSFARERYENRWFLLFCRLAVYANSAVNPILYNAMSAKFRSAFRAQLSCSCRTYTRTKQVVSSNFTFAFLHKSSFGLSTNSSFNPSPNPNFPKQLFCGT